MTDYIEREAAIASAFSAKAVGNSAYRDVYDTVSRLRLIPASDVRPVVRCKECVFYNRTGCADGFGWCEDTIVSTGVMDDWYCADWKPLREAKHE